MRDRHPAHVPQLVSFISARPSGPRWLEIEGTPGPSLDGHCTVIPLAVDLLPLSPQGAHDLPRVRTHAFLASAAHISKSVSPPRPRKRSRRLVLPKPDPNYGIDADV